MWTGRMGADAKYCVPTGGWVGEMYEFTNEGKHLTLTEYDAEEDEYDTIELSSLAEQKLPEGKIYDVIDMVGGK